MRYREAVHREVHLPRYIGRHITRVYLPRYIGKHITRVHLRVLGGIYQGTP